MGRIYFDRDTQQEIINLNKAETQELEETGYCMVDDDFFKNEYFVVKIDDYYYVAKKVDFGGLYLNCEENKEEE